MEKKLNSFALTIAYNGTPFQGWQRQAPDKNSSTVQELVENALEKVLQQKISIQGSGRTDAGVHARAQMAHLRVETNLEPGAILRGANTYLPPEIRITQLEKCSPDFHAQMSAKTKTYRYFILHSTGKDGLSHWPFLHSYAYFVSFPLNYEIMQSALSELVGEHDFKSFQNVGTPVANTVRTILEAKLVMHENADFPWLPPPNLQLQLLEIRICGTGFLKQMVRAIVGTTIEVGRGKIAAKEMAQILAAQDRSTAGPTAPAQGLFLDHVEY